MDDPLSKLCPAMQTSNQHGYGCWKIKSLLTYLLNRKRGGVKFEKKCPLKLQGQLELNFAYIGLGWSPFKIMSGNADLQSTWPPLLKIEKKEGEWNLKFFPCEITGPIGSKLCWNDPLVIPFQNFVWQSHPRTKMDAVTKN